MLGLASAEQRDEALVLRLEVASAERFVVEHAGHIKAV
jgi:hypothetical protein